MRLRAAAVSIALLWASACAAPQTGAQADPALIEDGRVVAETQCASCHAIGRTGPSPREGAPPLRYVLSRYAADQLEADLNEGIRMGHSGMPEFSLPIRGLDALIPYLQSIQEDPPE